MGFDFVLLYYTGATIIHEHTWASTHTHTGEVLSKRSQISLCLSESCKHTILAQKRTCALTLVYIYTATNNSLSHSRYDLYLRRYFSPVLQKTRFRSTPITSQ